jgi:hypothetical protein
LLQASRYFPSRLGLEVVRPGYATNFSLIQWSRHFTHSPGQSSTKMRTALAYCMQSAGTGCSFEVTLKHVQRSWKKFFWRKEPKMRVLLYLDETIVFRSLKGICCWYVRILHRHSAYFSLFLFQ